VTQVATPVIEFQGILPPFEAAMLARPHACLPASTAGPGGLILDALWPLGRTLEQNLAAGDARTALDLAYRTLSRLCDELAAHTGATAPSPDQVRIHALLVELQCLPLACCADGTLAPAGTTVHVKYRHWLVGAAQAAFVAEALIEHCQSLWPNVWIIR
jgi:hypothetical protein